MKKKILKTGAACAYGVDAQPHLKGWGNAETDAMQCDEAKAALEKFGMSSHKPMAHRVRKPQSAWLAA